MSRKCSALLIICLSLALLILITGCGSSSSAPQPAPNPVTVNNPLPTLTSVSPSVIAAGAPDTTITVIGTNFVSTSKVNLNGAALTTGFVSATQLSAAISTNDLKAAGMAQVTVSSPTPGGGQSGSLPLSVVSVASLSLLATPMTVGAADGPWMLAVSALDPNGAPLVNLPVSLSTTAGTVSQPNGVTDVNGGLRATVTPLNGGSSQVVVVTATTGAQTAAVNIVFQNSATAAARTAARMRRLTVADRRTKPQGAASMGATTNSQPFVFGASSAVGSANPFTNPNNCFTDAQMTTTVTVACQQLYSQQNLSFQPSNIINEACNAINAIGNVQDVLSCVGTGVTIVACLLSGTGIGAAICAGTLDFTLDSLGPECAQFIASELTQRFLGDSAAQALQQVFILQDPTNLQNIITEGCIALQALFPPMNGNPGGRVYVADSVANTINVYDAIGNPISVTGQFPGLSSPDGMAYDAASQRIYVANLGNNTITVYDLSGNPVSLPSGAFSGLVDPEDITLDQANRHFYVNEPTQNLILVFDEDGNTIPLPNGAFANLNQPFGVGWDSVNDAIYVANFGDNTINVYDEQGNQLVTATGAFAGLNSPDDISWDPSTGNLYVSATASAGFDVCVNNNIFVYTPDGAPVSAPGGFPGINGPDEIVSNGSAIGAMYYVANICGGSVTVYDRNGNPSPLPSGAFANLVQPAGVVVVP